MLTLGSLTTVGRRAAIVLALAILAAAGMIAAGAAPDAWACTDSNISNHCYAVAQVNTPVNWGAAGYINLRCLYQPNNGNIASNELWDADTNHHWIEAGAVAGVDYNGYYDNKNWFWADARPGDGYHYHSFTNTVPLNTDEFVEIVYARGEVWDIYGGPYFLGKSTTNSVSPTYESAGSEYLGASNSGIRDIGHVSGLQWIDDKLVFHDWGGNGFALQLSQSGPGAYITAQYDASSSYLGWSGPC
jgi:hypothetical protein